MATFDHVIQDANEETAYAIIESQLHDVETPETAGESDEDVARRMYMNELLQERAILEALEDLDLKAFPDLSDDDDSHASTPQPVARLPAPTFECIICMERVPLERVWQAPCQDRYCISCLEDLVRSTMSDQGLYPPRCCQRVLPWDEVKAEINEELVAEFEGMKEELDTPDGKKVYCSGPTCRSFLKSQDIEGEVGTCPSCHTTTCTICKAASHTGDCPEDQALQETLRLAREQGWQRCQSCNRVVDLTFGCYHITCTCRYEFCYLCGERWKTCRCPQWDEGRLLERAEELVNRNPQAAGAAPAQHDAQVAEEAQNLQENHDCDHASWMRVQGRHDCEECEDTLYEFIYECRQCRLWLCARCRHNRR